MVSIVIVSHSATLASGVRELATQMVQSDVPIAIAGGIDDPENPIGTDPMKVMEAIESVYSEDGVVVLMDLGSALLSTETALEFLTAEQQEHIYLCSAPLVEGTMVAVVQASIGATAEQVMQEAQGALASKHAQLGYEVPSITPDPSAPSLNGSTESLTLVIPNKLGLHARPAARFVGTANRFQADMRLQYGDQIANAKSINQVATLGVRQGETVVVLATGADATAALAAIEALANDNFGDAVDAPAEIPITPDLPVEAGEWVGIPASPGIAIGPVVQYRPRLPEVVAREVEDTAVEWDRLLGAIEKARQEIETLHAQAVKRVGKAEAAIFEAHLLLLADPDLLAEAKQYLTQTKHNAEAVWQKVIADTADRFRALDDPYLQARAVDVQDVGQRVIGQLMDLKRPLLSLETPAILIAADLTPSDTAQFNPEQVLGICTEMGGSTSHSAILARALGIPAIVGMGDQVATLPEGQQIAIDGQSGRLWVDPDEAELARLTEQRQAWLAEQQQIKRVAQQPAITQDGQRIEIGANIGDLKGTAVALDYGAEGVGLLRTEFLFMGRTTAPTEEEQVAVYNKIAEALDDKPIIIRTLDVGGDKPLPYFDQGEEDNPFLGWRGIRFCLDQPAIFKPQLRAILRASHQHPIKMMFPMIGALTELQAAKALLAEVKAELTAENIPYSADMPVGIMIEVPAAVAIADQLASEVDFFSIGTNDLTQYVMAADRGNRQVAALAQALQPAVLRMIKQTVDAAHLAGIWVGMCGELAGNPLATALLIGLGLDELSMSAPSIPAVKEAVRHATCSASEALAEQVLQLGSVEAVVEFLQQNRIA